MIVDALQAATRAGTSFVFGYVGDNTRWTFTDKAPGPLFFFQILPLVIVVAALSAILWHWHVLRWVTKGFAFVFSKPMGLGGATSLAVSANVFMGMTEAPVLIKPYIPSMTRSEIFIVMVAGFATIAGSVMVIYVTMLEPVMAQSAVAAAHRFAHGGAGGRRCGAHHRPRTDVSSRTRPRAGLRIPFDHGRLRHAAPATGMQIVLNIATMLIARWRCSIW